MRVGGYETIAPVPPFPTGDPGFMNELKTYDVRQVHWNVKGKIPAEALCLIGRWQIKKSFPDPDKLLDTAYGAWERFAAAQIPAGEKEIVLETVLDETFSVEEYQIEISCSGIRLQAADTEGLRRAVYHLIDLCRSAAVPALNWQVIRQKPWLKNRISRCFFGPIKRAPFFRDELTDDIDYYPEPYLDRMAAEGINGIWLTVVWQEMAVTDFFPVDPQREQRIAKLRQTVEKCRRYGIKVWVFCIEPKSWTEDFQPPVQDMKGECHLGNVMNAFCIASENSKKYIRDTVCSIFRDTPHLGGMMLISLGERATSCLSYAYDDPDGVQVCRSRCGLTSSQILDGVLSAIRQGIKDAGSDAQVLSWLYNPRAGQIPEWWFSLPEELNEEKILAFNFESGCTKQQDGRVYAGGDYWLSCSGPSDRFGRIAAAAKGHCELAAKIQVGCSHELATVPVMPVPGNLYEKYKRMKQLGVKHVLQCWYFGNYPGLMNRAAGRLAYESFEGGEMDFLTRLALPEWGPEYAGKVAAMWSGFGQAYANYPLDIQFQYYGPMHDGVVWPLHLKQVMKPMPRSWKPDDFPAGDAVGESMTYHELSHVVDLSAALAEQWSKAAGLLPELRGAFADETARQRDCDLYEALDILFNSGARIMSFYAIRQALFTAPVGCHALLERMRDIVLREKEASRRMIQLCQQDSRLGYHSEAEVFKFYPAKLEWRIRELEKLEPVFDALAHLEPAEIREALAWEGETYRTGVEYTGKTLNWRADVEELELVFTLCVSPLPEGCKNEQLALFTMDAQGTRFPLEIPIKGEGKPSGFNDKCLGINLTYTPDRKIRVQIPLSKINYAKEIFVGVCRTWQDAQGTFCHDIMPDGEYSWEQRLNFIIYFSADKMGKLIISK